MLVALLACGMKPKHAIDRAPWLESGDLREMQRRARSIPFDDIGPLIIKLTFAEYEHYKAWRFWPCDRSRQEVREWMKQRRADNRRRHKQDEREWRWTLTVAERRDNFVRRKLAKGATTLPKLYESARYSPAFWPQRAACPSFLKKGRAHCLRTAVHKVVNRMERRGEVETRIGHDGVRRVWLSPDFNVEEKERDGTEKGNLSVYPRRVTPKSAESPTAAKS
jgi:hypothetical protein